MKIQGKYYKSVQFDIENGVLTILDQTLLPFQVKWLELRTFANICNAIVTMQVRGAPAIGAVAAYGIVLAIRELKDLQEAAIQIKATRPTAINLAWAVDRMLIAVISQPRSVWYQAACCEAEKICTEDVNVCSAIGDFGLGIIEKVLIKKNTSTINILTHCNAGWLATVDWGTALAPVYKAQQKHIDVHVWVDETRPRNQGALLTSFELTEQGVAHTLIADNAGGYLMQAGKIDLCIVGSDRTAANGDVCNKIGTYLKALAAEDNQIPFYVALPSSTIDWAMPSGRGIPIEYRDQNEVLTMTGMTNKNHLETIRVAVDNVTALNPAFDVTPARLVTGLITEFGVFDASESGLQQLKLRQQNAG